MTDPLSVVILYVEVSVTHTAIAGVYTSHAKADAAAKLITEHRTSTLELLLDPAEPLFSDWREVAKLNVDPRLRKSESDK